MPRTLLNFEDRLFSITRNLVEYGNYEKSPDKVAKILNKYFPEKTFATCKACIEDSSNAYLDGVRFVKTHKERYWKNEMFSGTTPEEQEFFRAHDRVKQEILMGFLHFIFNWYHER